MTLYQHLTRTMVLLAKIPMKQTTLKKPLSMRTPLMWTWSGKLKQLIINWVWKLIIFDSGQQSIKIQQLVSLSLPHASVVVSDLPSSWRAARGSACDAARRRGVADKQVTPNQTSTAKWYPTSHLLTNTIQTAPNPQVQPHQSKPHAHAMTLGDYQTGRVYRYSRSS